MASVVFWIETTFRRIQSRPISQLLRGALCRVWPISLLLNAYYSRRLNTERWNQITRRARALYVAQASRLTDAQIEAVAALKSDGVYQTKACSMLSSQFRIDHLMKTSDALLNTEEMRAQISRRRSIDGEKWYVIRAFGYKKSHSRWACTIRVG